MSFKFPLGYKIQDGCWFRPNLPPTSTRFTSTEKYTRGVSAVESILTLDRLRQSVAVKELEQARGQPITMRKTASVPNFSQVNLLLQLKGHVDRLNVLTLICRCFFMRPKISTWFFLECWEKTELQIEPLFEAHKEILINYYWETSK